MLLQAKAFLILGCLALLLSGCGSAQKGSSKKVVTGTRWQFGILISPALPTDRQWFAVYFDSEEKRVAKVANWFTGEEGKVIEIWPGKSTTLADTTFQISKAEVESGPLGWHRVAIGINWIDGQGVNLPQSFVMEKNADGVTAKVRHECLVGVTSVFGQAPHTETQESTATLVLGQ